MFIKRGPTFVKRNYSQVPLFSVDLAREAGGQREGEQFFSFPFSLVEGGPYGRRASQHGSRQNVDIRFLCPLIPPY